MPLTTPLKVQRIVLAAAVALLGQGLTSLLAITWLGIDTGLTDALLATDSHHGLLHAAWGAAMAGVVLRYWRRPAIAAWTAIAFGVFYTGLGVLGLLVDQPLGLHLWLGEKLFHLVAGPAMLAVGGVGLRFGRAELPSPVVTGGNG